MEGGHWVFVLVFLSHVGSSQSSHSSNAKLLLSLKSAIVDPSGFLDGWREANYSHYCSWAGVQCDSFDRIIGLDISNMNLSGQIAPQIGYFHSLINFSVAANKFTGPFPSNITNGLGLKSFNICSSMFVGNFPTNFSKLKALEILATLKQHTLS
ncbi:hypothetical protein SUGI_0311590 [Cryptomeria japonica]|uniref:MDIS1-interacting receptor like kinase 1-like n=1 Tax=Cryptomeria japonica TaxID=3369 RepID=UPI002408DF20|nr:MDIS1-interacting receptor like kinase 1-like [Cryptomeria japonica]GLJ17816.1 hypothetical protein SUGI_0311590 [Cryptomeria japonica]